MREKYESLSLAVLKDLAKARGMKGISTLRKPALIERMLEEDAKESAKGNPEEVRRSTSGENNLKEKKQETEKTEYHTRPAGETLQERKEYRTERTEQEHRSVNVRRDYNRDYNREANRDYNRESARENGNVPSESTQLDSGEKANGILEVLPDGYGFIRCANYLPGENDIYVSPSQIRRFNLKTGDIIQGNIRIKTQGEKFSALLYVSSINGFHPTLLKDVAKSILKNNKDMHLIILLIDERPEEVTDIKEAIQGPNVEVIYSTFDELPEHHKRVSEMVVERARRLVEHKQDVIILLDSITRLARAYNLIIPPSGRTLSGGLDPAALHMPKRFFGAARNMREGGSLTILATALVDTGSKMDDVIYEEFKGTGNMELVLDRKLQEKRVFPAIDIQKSGTRREDLLLSKDEQEAVYIMRKALNGMKSDEAVEQILNTFARTRTNAELVQTVKKQKFL